MLNPRQEYVIEDKIEDSIEDKKIPPLDSFTGNKYIFFPICILDFKSFKKLGAIYESASKVKIQGVLAFLTPYSIAAFFPTNVLGKSKIILLFLNLTVHFFRNSKDPSSE